MKKVILPLVALMLSMVACQKENEGILTLEVEEYNTDAKLHLDDDNYAVWDNDDPIWINGAYKNVSVSEESGTATISGVSSSETGYKAIYPSSLVEEYYPNNGTLLIDIPSTQTYRTNATGKQVIDAPMAAYSTGGSLKFKNLGSILAVNVRGVERVLRIKVIATGADNRDVYIAGFSQIDFSGDRPTSEITYGNSNCITLYCDGEQIPENGKTFYIAIPSVEAKLTIIVDDGVCRYTKSQNDAMTFVSSHGYNVPFDASEVTPEQYAPKSNEIWYTSNNNAVINIPLATRRSLDINSNVYSSGKGVITFSSTVSSFLDDLFVDRNREKVLSLSLPYSLTTFPYNVFSGYTNLTTINYYYYDNPQNFYPENWGLGEAVALHLFHDLPEDYRTLWDSPYINVEFDL